jgi:Zn-dependent protease
MSKGAFRIFRFAGIDVFLHWSWFLIAAYEVSSRKETYSSPLWNAAEYLSLFAIVTLHEFGHALACRSVGGRADRIVLWPLGGIAYVEPPQRAGAVLWSIVAGPLVNLVLVPVFVGLYYYSRSADLLHSAPNAHQLIRSIMFINIGLFVFNVLPVYPLDGGQILRALLWFVIGRAKSLYVASFVGILGVAGLVGIALWMQSIWIGIMAYFAGSQCMNGFRQAKVLSLLERSPRRVGVACPSCHKGPPGGGWWVCQRCQSPFDTFETGAVCPFCRTAFESTRCPDCGAAHPISAWVTTPAPPATG